MKGDQMSGPHVDIIIPTFENGRIAQGCILSILRNCCEPFRFVIVNNGRPETLIRPEHYPHTHVIQMEKNTGWSGGVNAGLKWSLEHSDAEFVLLMNDDTQIMDHDQGWLTKMVAAFELDPRIGAVGPTSNNVMGIQTAFTIGLPPYIEAARLSGFCMLLRKDAVRKVGLLDDALPGGDDLDYSMRLRQYGYKLCICRRAFVYHHYAQTGRRVHGAYWDSHAHAEAIDTALIRKHGFKNWYECAHDVLAPAPEDGDSSYEVLERRLILKHFNGELEHGRVLDLGCGGGKTHERMVGVDLRPNGKIGMGANVYYPSCADVEDDVVILSKFADASVDGLVARHLFEHMIDPIKALRSWARVLKPGGKLVILSPDYRYCEAMACDPTHVHALTPQSTASMVEAAGGFEVIGYENQHPGFSFCLAARRTA